MIEEMRGCGYRKVGGLYLVGEGFALSCDRLPYNLEVCPVCGHGIKFSLGFTWIKPEPLFGQHKDCTDTLKNTCPLCNPKIVGERAGLMWVGEEFYTPDSFIREAKKLGVSKRINAIPKGFEVGKTWVYLAHRKAGTKIITENGGLLNSEIQKKVPCPAIFLAFAPTRIEKLIWESEATEENLKELRRRGITPVIVHDGDPDHNPKRSIRDDLKLAKVKNQSKLKLGD